MTHIEACRQGWKCGCHIVALIIEAREGGRVSGVDPTGREPENFYKELCICGKNQGVVKKKRKEQNHRTATIKEGSRVKSFSKFQDCALQFSLVLKKGSLFGAISFLVRV